MKILVVTVFLISLLAVGFLALNFIWGWLVIAPGMLIKIGLSVLVCSLLLTGIVMMVGATAAKNPTQPEVGKKGS